MDPTTNPDMNQLGDPTQQMQTPQQSGNYLTPQQRAQMSQYANSLMAPQTSHTLGAGLANMARSAVGGYLSNQANGPPSPVMNGIFGNVPTPQSIVSGIFGGGSPQPPAQSSDPNSPMNLSGAVSSPSP